MIYSMLDYLVRVSRSVVRCIMYLGILGSLAPKSFVSIILLSLIWTLASPQPTIPGRVSAANGRYRAMPSPKLP